MSKLGKISETLRDSLDSLAEGWHDLWNTARHAITRFTPDAQDQVASGNAANSQNRWGLISAEMHESTDDLTVALEAPGLSKEDFEVFVSGQSLIVRGSKSASEQRTQGHYLITERAYGRFERQFDLPVEVDDDQTKASYKHGVLTIEMKKSTKARPRVISIDE